MSTFALINIEGSLSVPRSRPLAALPASFGGEWRLLPPGFCPRDDLKALYAALLRTFCLSDDAMLSMCRWLPRVAADAAKAGVSAAKSVAGAGTAKAQAVGPVTARTGTLVQHETSAKYAKRMLTGGAIAISASTVLAWLAISHAPQDVTFSPDVLIHQASQAVRAAIDEARRSQTEPRHDSVSGRVAHVEVAPLAVGSAAASAPVATMTSGAVAAQPASTVAVAAAPASASESVPARSPVAVAATPFVGPPASARVAAIHAVEPAQKPASPEAQPDAASAQPSLPSSSSSMKPAAEPPKTPQTPATRADVTAFSRADIDRTPAVPTAPTKSTDAIEAPVPPERRKFAAPAYPVATGGREPTGTATASVSASAKAHYHAHQLPRVAPVPHSANPAPRVKYSHAGHYSPPQRAATDFENYGSIATSASTYTNRAVASSHAAPNADTGSTEWMNHMSQRRLTETPSNFSR